ncbi:MAG: L-seryl-tRNA(Sec) selenium transferase [Myxococcota bacterium]|nr:L-seryl-tRNA(Sec) selenium transferase [Myxococcota bacterium]
MVKQSLRQLPSVHQLIEELKPQPITKDIPPETLTEAARLILGSIRKDFTTKRIHAIPTKEQIHTQILQQLSSRFKPYHRVINATGVLLHTNLGRSPLPENVSIAMNEAHTYCDLEFDLVTGKRTSRLRGVSELLTKTTGSDSGLVVNNCAAALILSLSCLHQNKPVAISRGQLIEIGGGFRLPSMISAAGVELMEVGTTNRTRLSDFQEAAEAGAKLFVVVHRSNFSQVGYVEEPTLGELVKLAKPYGAKVIYDQGTGCIVDTEKWNLPKAPTVQEGIAQNVDLTIFSTDKLLGGPQGGAIVGSEELIAQLKKHPLARAFRCDKIQLAGIMATLDIYRKKREHIDIPLFRQLNTSLEKLQARVEYWRSQAGYGEVITAIDTVGGGTMPTSEIQSVALAISSSYPQELANALRHHDLPIIGHISENQLKLHPRAISENDDQEVISALIELRPLCKTLENKR